MTIPLKVVILEDHAGDAELMAHELRRGGFAPDWQRVETEADYLAALAPPPDLILADYSLPQFDALRALRLWQEHGLDIPFIVVTGSISEEVAVQCMKQGAADYLLKDRLARLGPAVEHALAARQTREASRRAEQALRESETRFSTIFHASPAAIAVTRLGDNQFVDINKAWQAMTGYTRAEVEGHTPAELNLWANPEQRQRLIETLRVQGAARTEVQIRRKSGEICDVLISAEFIELAGVQYLLTMAQDITARKQAEQKLAEQLDELRRWHAATLGREGRIMELKREVNELLAQIGQPPRYLSVAEDLKGLEDL